MSSLRIAMIGGPTALIEIDASRLEKNGRGRRPCKPPSFETPGFATRRRAPQDKVRGVRTDWFHGIDRLGRVLIKAQTSAFDGQTEVSDQPERYRQRPISDKSKALRSGGRTASHL